ncbi:hypothetical protein ACSQ67_010305 [Phaseolus vulgaris]
MQIVMERGIGTVSSTIRQSFHNMSADGGLIGIAPPPSSESVRLPHFFRRNGHRRCVPREELSLRRLYRGDLNMEVGGRVVHCERTRDAGVVAGDIYNTPVRVRQRRSLWEAGESNVQQKWRSKGVVGSPHMGIHSSSRLSINSNTLIDGDFGVCNDKFWKVEFMDKPSKLWELVKIRGCLVAGRRMRLLRKLNV